MFKKYWMLLLCFVTLGNAGCAGEMPTTLGAVDGRLASCPTSPNCVSTQADPGDAEHYMPPVPFTGPVDVAQSRLLQLIRETPRSEIVTDQPGYVHATFRSPRMGFVDDAEFLFDAEAGLLHFRSAARLGHSDNGVNRERMESLSRQFTE
jgi:uncharacterized protein (DUF1499 family)